MLGMGCALVIFTLVTFEMSFDTYHSQVDRMYRVVRDAQQGDRFNQSAAMPHPFADALRTDVSGLDMVVKVHGHSQGLVTIVNSREEEIRFSENQEIAFTESNYFDFFDYQFLAGASRQLNEPGHAVITREKAASLFGLEGEDLSKAPGRVFKLDNKLVLTVAGVVENPPANTDFPFGYFISYQSLGEVLGSYRNGQNWMGSNGNTNCYVLLNDESSVEQVEAQFPTFVAKYRDKALVENEHYQLQPLDDIHFNVYSNYSGRTVSRGAINTLLLVGFFIIILACINYVNISTSLAFSRAKTVGLRKILGSTSKLIVFEFLAEAILITFFAAIFSLGLAELILMELDSVLGYSLHLELFESPNTILFLLSLMLLICIFSGTYPAIMMSRFKSLDAFSARLKSRSGGGFFRRSLVVFQFIFSQVLIIGTIGVLSQLSYFQTKDLGFDSSDVVMVNIPNARNLNAETFKTQLLAHPGIAGISYGMSAPQSASSSNANWNYPPLGLKEDLIANFKAVDGEYFDLFDLTIIAGRSLTNQDRPNQVVVNERLLEVMNIADPQKAIGEKLQTRLLKEVTIIGVVKDFHLLSLKQEITPSILFNYPGYYFNAAIKLQNRSDIASVIDHVEGVWQEQFPDKIFEHNLLSDQISYFYADEERLSQLVKIFTTLAILIACMGLYGLVSFKSHQKEKEIGIRKVLGASLTSILKRFLSEFVVLILIAFLLAAPIAYIFINGWLDQFTYRINLGPKIFALGLSVSFLITLLTAGYNSIKAATANPVTSLRDD